jgi:hypothetical protein
VRYARSEEELSEEDIEKDIDKLKDFDKVTKDAPFDEEDINYNSDDTTYENDDDIESDNETGSLDEDDEDAEDE